MPIERAASDREPWALMPSSSATFPGPIFECSPKSMRNRISGAGFMDLGRNQVVSGVSLYQKCATLFMLKEKVQEHQHLGSTSWPAATPSGITRRSLQRPPF